MKNKRIASSSAAYKPIKPVSNNYQKNNYDTQTDNKKNNRNIDMSMGLEEGKKKLKTKTMDQKQETPSLPKEAVTSSPTLQTSSSLQPEVFDSSRDNAMSEIKEVADMGPDEASKEFSHVEEKQLDPSTTSINDTVKKADPDPTSFPAMMEPTLQEGEHDPMESIKGEAIVSKHDVEPDITQNHNETEEQEHLDESVMVYNKENKVSNSNLSNYDIYNPYIIGIKFWQAHSIAWINAFNEFLKA